MKPFYKSRKFLIAVSDCGVSLLTLFASQFVPQYAELIISTVGFLQIPVGVWIAAIAYEDGQAMRSGLKG